MHIRILSLCSKLAPWGHPDFLLQSCARGRMAPASHPPTPRPGHLGHQPGVLSHPLPLPCAPGFTAPVEIILPVSPMIPRARAEKHVSVTCCLMQRALSAAEPASRNVTQAASSRSLWMMECEESITQPARRRGRRPGHRSSISTLLLGSPRVCVRAD